MTAIAFSVRRRGRVLGRYLVLTAVAIVVLFPVYTAVVVAMQPLSAFTNLGVLVPRHLTLRPFIDAFDRGHLGRYLVNSFGVSAAITVGQVTTSILAAYAFAFLRFRGRSVLFVVFLATLMIPTEVTIVANFETVQRWHWTDTYAALVVPFLAFAFGTFLLRQAFLSIPRELSDAALVDGYGHIGFLTKVAVPLARPSIAALTVFSFLGAWNQYLWPLLVTNDDHYRTVQIGLKQLAGTNSVTFNVVMAGTLIAALPIVVLLVLFERHLVRGLTAGAVKG